MSVAITSGKWFVSLTGEVPIRLSEQSLGKSEYKSTMKTRAMRMIRARGAFHLGDTRLEKTELDASALVSGAAKRGTTADPE